MVIFYHIVIWRIYKRINEKPPNGGFSLLAKDAVGNRFLSQETPVNLGEFIKTP